MPNMTIKRWDTSANNNVGGWVEQYPKTTQDMIYDSGSTTTSLFDANKKLKVDYLPDAVFDSLYFRSTLNASATDAVLADAFQAAVEHAITNRQGVVAQDGSLASPPLGLEGYYFVVSTTGTIDELQGNPQQASALATGTGFDQYYFRWQFSRDDSGGGATQPSSSGLMEVGDWIVVQSITGVGTLTTPLNITFGVISNTYEVMAGADGSNAGAKGLVPSPGATDNLKFLRGDGTWVVPSTLSNEQVQDIVGGMLTGNTETNITVTYQDSDGTIDFVVPSMVGADFQNNTAGSAGVVPAPAVSDVGKFLRGDATYAIPDKRAVEIDGTSLIAYSSSTALDLQSGLGVSISTTANAGEAEFKMEYPIAVKSTAPTTYQVADALWFDIS